MRAYYRWIALLLVLGLPLTTVMAAETGTHGAFIAPVVALIDMQRILEESAAAKSVQKQLETQRAKFQTETEGEENELRQAEQDLNKAHDRIAADVFTEREQQLRQRFLAVERRVQARRKVLDQGFTDSMDEVRASLLTIVDATAKEHGVNLVLIKQQAFWADKGFDITDEVLDRLNKKLPSITVKLTPEDEQ